MPDSSSGESDDDDSDDGSTELVAAVLAARKALDTGQYRSALLQLLKLASAAPIMAEALEAEVIASVCGAAQGQTDATARFLFGGARRALPRLVALCVAEGGELHRRANSATAQGEKSSDHSTRTRSAVLQLAAVACFEQALALDPTDCDALEGLESLRSFAAERCHFRMINDGPRNTCYDTVIQRALADLQREDTAEEGRPGKMTDDGDDGKDAAGRTGAGEGALVLDIGSGTSVLSLMAARAGAAHVWGCEVNPVLCEVTRQTVAHPAHAAFAARVSVLNAHSDNLVVAAGRGGSVSVSGGGGPGGKIEGLSVVLPRRVDLVVTELVDSGLVGERMVRVLGHAATHLLKPGGAMVPAGAELSCIPIEAPELRPRQRILDDVEAAEAWERAVEVARDFFSSVASGGGGGGGGVEAVAPGSACGGAAAADAAASEPPDASTTEAASMRDDDDDDDNNGIVLGSTRQECRPQGRRTLHGLLFDSLATCVEVDEA